MTEEQKSKCHKIIHTAAASAAVAGGGLAQLPGSDSAIIVPIQIGMIQSLGAVFGINVSESSAKSLLMSAMATICGRTVYQFLVGWIPGIGNVINASTAAGITEAIGWFAAEDFDREEKAC